MISSLSKARLENGDHLSRAEFEYLYHLSPDINAELIEGVVYVASPVRADQHGEPHAAILGWLVMYKLTHPNVSVLDNATVRLDANNEPQPDALMRFLDGQSSLDEDGYISGAPELIVEISASSASYDLHEKKEAYRRSGVKEYLVWQVRQERLQWFYLDEGQYSELESDKEGLIHSLTFEGLALDIEALLEGDLTRAFRAVQN